MNQQANKSNGFKFLWLTFLVFVMDLVTKLVIVSTYSLHQSVKVLPFFSISYIRNYGAAFGLFLGQRWLLVIVALVICLFIIRLLYKTPKSDYFNNIGLSLVLGGALGNLSDRFYHGYVIDFLDFYIKDWHYPAFNIADSAICIGVVLLMMACFKITKYDKRHGEAQ